MNSLGMFRPWSLPGWEHKEKDQTYDSVMESKGLCWNYRRKVQYPSNFQ